MDKSIASRIEHLLPAFQKDDVEILVGLVVLVAYADGVVSDDELEILRGSLETIFRSPLGMIVVKTFVGSAIDDIKAAGGDAYAEQIGKELRERGRAEEGVKLAYEIAFKTDGLSREESDRLEILARGAGIGGAQLAEIVAAAGR